MKRYKPIPYWNSLLKIWHIGIPSNFSNFSKYNRIVTFKVVLLSSVPQSLSLYCWHCGIAWEPIGTGETCGIMSAPHLEIGSNSCFSCFRTLDDIEIYILFIFCIYIYIKIPSCLLILAKNCHCLLCCLCLSGSQVDRKLLVGFSPWHL